MPETTVCTNFLQPLKIITQLRINAVGQNLRILSVNDVPLPVQEPRGDLELRGALNDIDNALELIRVKFTSAVCTTSATRHGRHRTLYAPLVEVNIGLFANKVGVTTPNTLDLGQSVHDLALAINISVEETQDVLNVKLTSCWIHSNC